jgi:hypothetical protein
MSTAPDIRAAGQDLYDKEVPAGRDLVSRFRIAPGTDGLLALHNWLEGLKSEGTIVAWYDGGTISDTTGTDAVVEFETTRDRAKALALWPMESGQPEPKPIRPEAIRRPVEKALRR